MPENIKQLAHDVIEELWITKESLPFKPTADIDMVWVLSTPGTVKELPPIPPYDRNLTNLSLVEAGINLVRSVTGLRLNKPAEAVTREDVDTAGPIFLYNGESAAGGNTYHQNEHLAELAAQPDFPIPASKMIIAEIEEVNTPGQIKQLAQLLKDGNESIHKIAVVSGLQHSVRVSRYLEQHKQLLPETVELVNAASPLLDNESMIAGVEARKVIRYYQMGHLARNSYFGTPDHKSGRPDLRQSHSPTKRSS